MKSEYLIQGNEITYISFCSVIQSLVIYMWSLNVAVSVVAPADLSIQISLELQLDFWICRQYRTEPHILVKFPEFKGMHASRYSALFPVQLLIIFFSDTSVQKNKSLKESTQERKEILLTICEEFVTVFIFFQLNLERTRDCSQKCWWLQGQSINFLN